jgi:GT2 family glycosyltransferase
MILKLEQLGCELQRLNFNAGYGPALNYALSNWLAVDSAPYAVICPHDALPQPDCVGRIVAAMSKRPRAGLASAEYGTGVLPGYSMLRGYGGYPAERGTGWCAAEYPNGTLFVVSRQCLADIGLFDPRYFAYGEEYDLGHRARKAGWEVGQVWGAIVANPIRVASSDVAWYLNVRNGLLAMSERTGSPTAILRSTLLVLGGLRWAVSADGKERGAPLKIRLRAIYDFWTKRFGPPPEDL